MKLDERAKTELRNLARSAQIRKDLSRVFNSRHNSFIKDGQLDADHFIIFLTEYNRFINHAARSFHKITGEDNKL